MLLNKHFTLFSDSSVTLCFRGHVLLIVNVASQCGLTKDNYKELVELDEKYKESKGLRILAFPCNQFGGQVIYLGYLYLEKLLSFVPGFVKM